jgi:hypothetical protein
MPPYARIPEGLHPPGDYFTATLASFNCFNLRTVLFIQSKENPDEDWSACFIGWGGLRCSR